MSTDREPRPQTDRASSASAATSSAPHAARDVPYSAAADSVAAVTAVSHPQAAAAVNTHYNASLGAATKGKGQHASPRPPAAGGQISYEYMILCSICLCCLIKKKKKRVLGEVLGSLRNLIFCSYFRHLHQKTIKQLHQPTTSITLRWLKLRPRAGTMWRPTCSS